MGIGACKVCGVQAGVFRLKQGLCKKCRNEGRAYEGSGLDFSNAGIYKHYYFAAIAYALLFFNIGELFSSNIEFDDVFSITRSIAYAMADGITDSRLSRDQRTIFYWLLNISFVVLAIFKSKKAFLWLVGKES